MILENAYEYIRQGKYSEALYYLRTVQLQLGECAGVDLLWGQIAVNTLFRYLGVVGARSEISKSDSPEAKDFIEQLRQSANQARLKTPPDYPWISNVGVLTGATAVLWERCADSLEFQANSHADLVLVTGEKRLLNRISSPGVSTILCEDPEAAIESAIHKTQGEIVSIIEDPSAIFSEQGLLYVSAIFRSRLDVHVLQTERLMYSAEGIHTILRHSAPEWSESLLMNPVTLEEPSCLFSWRGVYFRKETLLAEGLPFDKSSTLAQALRTALKIVKKFPIHTARIKSILDASPLIRKSIALPLRTVSHAVQVIHEAKTRLKGDPSLESPDIIQISPPQRRHDVPPNIAPTIFTKPGSSSLPISLVTASFNSGEYLERCIDSILSQNYPMLQYGIMDGGSTDGSVDIIKKYERYLSFWRSAPDNGHYAAVQQGIDRFTGTIHSWLNADDLLLPYTLSLVSALFSENPHVEWMTGKPCLMVSEGSLEAHPSIPVYNSHLYLSDEFDNPFIQQEGTFWRKTLWEKAGGCLDLRYELAGDMELWTRFLEHACLYSVSVPLGVFRERKDQRSKTHRTAYFAECVAVLNRFRAENRQPFPMSEKIILTVPTVDQ